MKPYIGLRPYEEENQDIFFGRDREREILIDKLLVNKLTLLFAATGVGKSSLLRAAVLPQLKQPGKANLDVVYYSDWVSDPLEKLKEETFKVLKAREKVADDYPISKDISLKKFFRMCATFASDPLVVILDQFEEFFQYQKYRKNFIPFIEEFSHCISDRQAPVVFLISMREDFALELNIFKDYLLATPFENYFRLEKLKLEAARDVIRLPVERCGFRYEYELLDALLKDLAERDKLAQWGTSPAEWGKEIPAYVEPPYLQIVCTQLWDLEEQNPDKKIRMAVYEGKGRSKGFVDHYFREVMNKFTLPGKKIASLAFNHLVTPRGTKMAYPVKDLAGLLRVDEKDLENVLEKLRISRILRSQKREGVIWYELYHDIFSGIIYDWNEKFKAKQRFKRASFITAAAILFILMLFVIYDIIANTSSYYMRLSAKIGISDTIEVYRGKLGTPDIFNLNRYQAETVYQRNQLEPDKLFEKKQIGEFNELNIELIGHLPIAERISAYWQAGEIHKALDLADRSISENDITRSKNVIDTLASFQSEEVFNRLKNHLKQLKNSNIRKKIIEVMGEMRPFLVKDTLVKHLKDQDEGVSKIAAEVLFPILNQEEIVEYLPFIDKGIEDLEYDLKNRVIDALIQIAYIKSIDPLIKLLDVENSKVQELVSEALIQISEKNKKAIPLSILKSLLKNQDTVVRKNAVTFLEMRGGEEAIELLLEVINDQDIDVRFSSIHALKDLGYKKTFEYLIPLLNHQDLEVRLRAVDVLGQFGSPEAVSRLKKLLKNTDYRVRLKAADVLHYLGIYSIESLRCIFTIQLGEEERYVSRRYLGDYRHIIKKESAIKPLTSLLKDQDPIVRAKAVNILGNFSDEDVVTSLINILRDPDASVKISAIKTLSQIGDKKAVPQLLALLRDRDANIRESAAEALGKIGSSSEIKYLINLLKDQNANVRFSAAYSLLQLDMEDTVEPWRIVLKRLKKKEDAYDENELNIEFRQIDIDKGLEPLTTLLKDTDWEVKNGAAILLSSIGSARSVDTLIPLLKDQYPPVRCSAAEALGEIGSVKAIEPLIALLKDPDSTVKKYVVEALGKIGDENAVEPLINVLKDKNSNVRKSAVEALGKIADEKSVEPLISALKDQDSKVRKSAAYVLGWIGSDKAVVSLIDALKDQDDGVRENAEEALRKIRDKKIRDKRSVDSLIAALKDVRYSVRENAAEALGKIGDKKAVDSLIAALKDEWYSVRENAAEALGKIGDKKAVDSLIAALKDVSNSVRENAAEALGKIGDKKAVDSLIAALKDVSNSVRENAAKALGKIRDKKAVDSLIAALKDERYFVRENAAKALGEIGDKKAVEPLIAALKDENEFVRISAAVALGNIGYKDKKVVEQLILAFKDENYFVRGFAADALGKIGDKKAVDPLIDILKDKNGNVRGIAALALGQIGITKAVEHFKTIKDDDLKQQFVLGLGNSPVKNKKEIIKTFYKNQGENIFVRMYAAYSLLKIGDEEGLTLLRQKSKSPDFSERLEVASILGEAPSKPGTTILLDMLKDEEIRVRAKSLSSLGSSNEASALIQLVKRYNHPHPKIREVVDRALDEISLPPDIALEVYKQIAVNHRERLESRLYAITKLGNSKNENSIKILIPLLDDTSDIIQFRSLVMIGKAVSQNLSPPLKQQLKNRLKEKLKELEDRKEKWRQTRDKDIETIEEKGEEEKNKADEKLRKELMELEPREYMEFQLAYIISLIDPENDGATLLSHHLANVRQGAWMAVGKSRNVSFIERLYRLQKESNKPWARHAAYRAMDEILINLEALGDKTELNQLENLFKELNAKEGQDFHPVLYTRMEWTIRFLKERVGQ
jgi:HEAT repeat protein